MDIPADNSAEKQTAAPPQAQRAWRPILLLMARALWIVIALISLTTFVVGIRQRYQLLTKSPNQAYFVTRIAENRFQAVPQWSSGLMASSLAAIGLSANSFAAWQVGLQILSFLVFCSLSLVLFLKQPNNLFVLYVSFLIFLAGSFLGLRSLLPNNQLIVQIDQLVQLQVIFGVLTLAYLFPTGHFVPRRAKWLMPLWFIMPVIATTIYFSYFSIAIENSPPQLILLVIPLLVFFLLFFGLMLSLPVAQVFRYRRVSTLMQRQQTKWFAFAVITYVLVFVAGLLIPAFDPSLYEPTARALSFHLFNNTTERIAWTFLALGITIPILRYRLWDIDLLINRTLVYTPLTAMLAGVFTVSSDVLKRFFVTTSGQPSEVVTVLTTLLVVALFDPLKKATQMFVDKNLKEAPDPTKRLRAYSDQVQNVMQVMDVEMSARRLLDETMAAFGAATGQVIIGSPHAPQVRYARGEANDDPKLTLVLGRDGRRFGTLTLGARKNGQPYSDADYELLEKYLAPIERAIGWAVRAQSQEPEVRE